MHICAGGGESEGNDSNRGKEELEQRELLKRYLEQYRRQLKKKRTSLGDGWKIYGWNF